MQTAVYREMNRAALDAAYNNRAAVPNYPALVEERRERSNQIRRSRPCRIDLRYGAGERERLDFFPLDEPNAPILLFIHGGYWQSSEKESHSYVAEGPLSRGIAVALVEYTLAPEAGIDQIVGEIARSIEWLRANARALGGEPNRIYVCGHSAGGHLTAMMLGKLSIAGAMPISGIFDLEPIRLNYLNAKLRLTEESALRNSPLRHPPAECQEVVVAVGAEELPELKRQSEDYSTVLAERGLPVRHLSLAGHNHFSILEEMAKPQGKLCEALVGLVEAGARSAAQA